MIWETIRLALLALRRNKLRSALTMLGIVIGVAAVIAMVTVGQGSSRSVTASIESLGTNVLTIRPGSRGFGPPSAAPDRPFTLRDAEALAELSVITHVSPTANASETVVAEQMDVVHPHAIHAVRQFLRRSIASACRARAWKCASPRARTRSCCEGRTSSSAT